MIDDIEDDEWVGMEMPTPCQRCGKLFDLHDGSRSDKWYPNTVICEACGDEESDEIELDEKIEELTNEISDLEITISDSQQQLARAREELVHLQTKHV